MANDFVANHLSFDAAGCNRAIVKMAEAEMNELSDMMITQFKWQIDRNGNGSAIMRNDAKTVVREILHEVLSDHLTYEVGFDESLAASMAKDFYVRVMVVIHGNQGGGHIKSKPGLSTWKKHVIGYGPSNAKEEYDIPQFDQEDVADGIRDNVIKNIESHFETMLIKLCIALDGPFFEGFITVR